MTDVEHPVKCNSVEGERERERERDVKDAEDCAVARFPLFRFDEFDPEIHYGLAFEIEHAMRFRT